MGSDFRHGVPAIELSMTSLAVDRGTDKWNSLCKRVREACENYGCFEIVYDKIPLQLRAEAFSLVRQLFSLPLETKKKNVNPKPFHGYCGEYPHVRLYESLGLEDASNFEALILSLNTIVTMMRQLDELKDMIEMMILDSYGLGEKSDLIIPCNTLLRVMKCGAPPSGEEVGLTAHTDKLLSAILCEDQVSGIEFETKDGQWVKLSLSPSSFLFIVGDPLAWRNGRMHPVKHRVMMRGEKERISLGIFPVPTEGTIIKPPKELMDEEHPQILKEFDFMEFFRFFSSEEGVAIDSAKPWVKYCQV
ncbi:hypothetical protein PRUPE_1G468200 [Prunus persica]|uniref:Uncharacterized protein n=1 Tax=Prunus persica TaxID=3760 RepID=M5XBF9_PRUPE|nr:hypothetical protein PRUPE_1G468200 [Prunus persica]